MTTSDTPQTDRPQPGPPGIFVIFGASGDLTKRKLIPALFNLRCLGLLPRQFAVIGVAITPGDDASFRNQMSSDIREFGTRPFDAAEWDTFVSACYYLSGDFNDGAVFGRLKEKIAAVQAEQKIPGGNVVFNLAVTPTLFGTVVTQLGAAGLLHEAADAYRRVIIEKPFGRDLDSARALDDVLHKCLAESQIFRIDHYLGKETVQNIMVFRFANMIFEPNWNRRYVDSVQITVAESLGVENRGGYLDHYGVLRDMLQNHMLSVLSLIAMEPPGTIRGDAVRNEKVKVLDAIRPMTPEDVLENAVRGQYGPGTVNGQPVCGYREEPSVDPHSYTETYAALRLFVENWRWADVPFYLRTGKRLAKHLTQVVIRFKRTPLMLFGEKVNSEAGPNALVLNIQPEENITIMIRAKRPGPAVAVETIPLHFDYSEFGEQSPATGYETLLHDCMVGDMTLFHREDSVDASWRIVNPILDVWGALPPRDFPDYAAGTWGPAAADKLLERDGRAWENPA
ncbi:MAG: glucose-6-phosphate dehydrogenase [Chthoniobacterales bacterium]|nr:glucose-6-phosphate dehydrogenase [Chthoniobacterales bacterium]